MTIVGWYCRLNQRTPFCTNATAICKNVGLMFVKGIEISHIYSLTGEGIESYEPAILDIIHDKMTQCRCYNSVQIHKLIELDVKVGVYAFGLWFKIKLIKSLLFKILFKSSFEPDGIFEILVHLRCCKCILT